MVPQILHSLTPLRFLHNTSTAHFDSALTTKLIQVRCRVGQISSARNLFDEMPNKNIVHFSIMIHGYASNGYFAESLQVFSQMQSSGIRPNSFAVVAVLLGSAGMRSPRIVESIHGIVIRSGMEKNPFTGTAMLDSYAKCGNPTSSYKLFKEMEPQSLPACNAMIAGLAHNDLFEEALLLFKHFHSSGLLPNSITMLNVARNCSRYGSFRLCESMHGYIVKLGLGLDGIVMNSVLEMYLSFGNSEIGEDFFRRTDVANVASWTIMINFLLEDQRPSEAFHMFRQMRTNGVEPDMVAMLSVITACAFLGDFGTGRSAHNQIILRGLASELPVMNSLITMYSNGGDPESARMSFDRIVGKSMVSWSAMVSGYMQNGRPGEGLRLLIRMRNEDNLSIDSITLVTALTACSELAGFKLCTQFHAYSFVSGLVLCKLVENSLVATYGKCGCLGLARRVFKEATFHNTVSWNAMISSCGVNGEGKAALSLFVDMEKSGVVPDGVTYLNLLTACSHSGLVGDGLVIFERMVKDERIHPSREHCGCVVDILARAGHLEEARELVISMPDEIGLNVWKALLGGYHISGDAELAQVAAYQVFQSGSKDLEHVVTLSNVYASVGRFESAENLRLSIGKKGLVKNVGFSLLDA